MERYRRSVARAGRSAYTSVIGFVGKTSLGTLVPALKGNSLHSNALFLIVAQGVMTVFGYAFWIIIARLYKSHDVGVASTLISVATLISQISILGLNNALVRFLPSSNQKNDKINTCLWLVTAGSIIITLGYVIGMPFFSPKLLFIRHDLLFFCLFLLSMVLVTINTFTDSVFLANRATKYNVIIYLFYSVIRLIAPFALLGLGALGIFAAHISGIILAVFMSLYYMYKKFDWRPKLIVKKSIIKLIGGYSLANYVAGFMWGLPLLIAPLIVVNKLGTSEAAYYYMAMMIVNVIQILPTSTTQSLFAEASHAEVSYLPRLVRKSLLFTLSVTCGAVILALLGGRFAIGVFGKEYAQNGATLLYWLASATIIMAVNMTANVVLKVRKQLSLLIGFNMLGAAATLGAYMICIPKGLAGAGIGFMLGQAALLLAYGIYFGVGAIVKRRSN